jgi:hypothetical protein
VTVAEPWFNEMTFGIGVGAIGGSLVGGLGGLWGTAVGILAPRGIGRAWLIGAGWVFVALGVVALSFGLVALVDGQPYGIWYPGLLLGIILTTVVGSLMPVVYIRYRQADERRLQAEEFRQE